MRGRSCRDSSERPRRPYPRESGPRRLLPGTSSATVYPALDTFGRTRRILWKDDRFAQDPLLAEPRVTAANAAASLTAPTIDRIVQDVWGLRYIDDLVLRRVDANYPGSGRPDFAQTAAGDIDWEQYLTDHQFSVVAAVGRTGTLAFRVAYDAYGEARHLPAKDINGDGKVDKTDTTLAQNASGKKLGQPGYNPDADWDRDGTVSTRDIAQYGSAAYVAALPQGQLAPAAIVADPLSPANARSDFNIGFCGYRFNGDIGAYTVRFRHYDPTPGMCRWLERDPAGYQDGPSLYSYLGRNPMAGTDPYGLSFWGDQYDYWFGDRYGEAERTLRENQRLVERHLQEQRRLGIISDRRYLEQSVAMRRDIDSVLTEMCLIGWEQQERKLETYVAITVTMVPVGEVVVGARALGAATVRTGTAAATAETAVAVRNTAMPVRYGPLNTGPLPEAVAKTFRGGSYTGTVISEAMTLYRVHGGTAGELGLYWTRTAPMGPLQSQIDLAILSAWGNTATRVTTIRVPPGTLIFDGFAAGQGGLLGGGSQVVIPIVNPSWIIR